MRARFQADADLNQTILIATLRQQPAVDFRSSIAAGLPGVPDPEVLAATARDGRILVTHDRRTMPIHFGEFILRQTSPGLLLIPQSLPIAVAVEELLLIWSVTEAEEWVNRICVLPF